MGSAKRLTACPAKWGGSAWRFLHYLTLMYPDKPTAKDRARFRYMFNMLPKLLPCNICAQHFKQLLGKKPVHKHLSSRSSLVKWLHDLHARINRENVPGKKRAPVPAMSAVVPVFQKTWRRGLRDFVFLIAFCLKKKDFPVLCRWLKAARQAIRSVHVPVASKCKSRADVLNALCRHYSVNRAKVLKKYTPLLNKPKTPTGSAVSKLKTVMQSLL
jgi:hypothetical protein